MKTTLAAAAGAASLLAVLGAPRPAPRAAGAVLDPGKVVDLTYTLDGRTPYWPGPRYHPFRSETIASLETDGVYSRSYCTPEHLGTHVDAPNHFEAGQIALDEIRLEDLMAPAVVIDMSARAGKDPDAVLAVADVRAWEDSHGAIPQGAIVLLRTGWGRRVAEASSYRNMDASGRLHFPSYSAAAATYLIERRRARALGIDTLSIDPGVSRRFEVHHIVNRAGRYGLENLANLERLPATGAFLIVAPVKIGGGSGGQARVLAVLP